MMALQGNRHFQMTRRGARARTLAAACAALAALTVTGCAGSAPGVVAYVGGGEITQRQLTVAVDGISEAFGPENPIKEQAVVDAMIRGEIAAQLATEKRITITDAERDALFKADPTGARLLTVDAAKVVAYDLADEQIVVKKVGAEAYLAAVTATKVKLNPRYGVWDGTKAAEGSAVLDDSSSLSKPGSPATP